MICNEDGVYLDAPPVKLTLPVPVKHIHRVKIDTRNPHEKNPACTNTRGYPKSYQCAPYQPTEGVVTVECCTEGVSVHTMKPLVVFSRRTGFPNEWLRQL